MRLMTYSDIFNRQNLFSTPKCCFTCFESYFYLVVLSLHLKHIKRVKKIHLLFSFLALQTEWRSNLSAQILGIGDIQRGCHWSSELWEHPSAADGWSGGLYMFQYLIDSLFIFVIHSCYLKHLFVNCLSLISICKAKIIWEQCIDKPSMRLMPSFSFFNLFYREEQL
jgi:hypothetical protein